MPVRFSVARWATPFMFLRCMSQTAVNHRCNNLRQAYCEEELKTHIWEEVSIVQDFLVDVSKQGPQKWLLALLLETQTLPMPEHLQAFIMTHVAKHLDPFIDGEITSPEEERGTSPMHRCLQAEYEKAHGRELPVPMEIVLALYVRHAVAKSNATQCFTDLVMGQGRLPLHGEPQRIHCAAIGVALEAAIVKDFGASYAKIQGVYMSAKLLEELAKEHSSKLFYDHSKNSERLAEANRLGELGRKEEMKRIFGIEV